MPSLVWMPRPIPSGMLCPTCIVSMVNGPIVTVSPASMTCLVACSSRPHSESLASTKPKRVSRVPQIGTFGHAGVQAARRCRSSWPWVRITPRTLSARSMR